MHKHGQAKQTIALFGGSFDPPHIAHQQIPLFLLKNHLVDEVWYVPVKHHPFGKVLAPDEQRVAMLEKMIQCLVKENPKYAQKLRIECWEVDKNHSSYTIQTLDALAKQHPEKKFSWVIGTDNLEKFHLWHEYQRIIQEFGVFVYPRVGYPPTPLRNGMTYLSTAPEVNVSSTELRQKIKAKEPITNLVTDQVEQHIVQEQLYQ
jgi:nicotinate-nucleotide adenylyltransferase